MIFCLLCRNEDMGTLGDGAGMGVQAGAGLGFNLCLGARGTLAGGAAVGVRDGSWVAKTVADGNKGTLGGVTWVAGCC